jgi:mannosyl-3-phosphoglycerate synthase
LGAAFVEAGIPELVDEQGVVRSGKGEGMLVGMALTRLIGRDFVGFIDADNYFPGAVEEYIKGYAAGFHMARTPYAMVRMRWRSKPSIEHGRFFFNHWGRTSQVTNQFLNLILSAYSSFGTDIITTGNAGEHAISMQLALRLQFAADFAIEPYEYVHLFELFGGLGVSPYPAIMKKGVEVFQIQTRNPHFHDKGGSEHIHEMRLQALKVLYHSSTCPDWVKEDIVDCLREQGMLDRDELPGRHILYPPLLRLDEECFLRTLAKQSRTFEQLPRVMSKSVTLDAPISIPSDQTDRKRLRTTTMEAQRIAELDREVHRAGSALASAVADQMCQDTSAHGAAQRRVAVATHGDGREHDDERRARQEYPTHLSHRSGAVHQAADRCHEMGDRVDVDDRLEPGWHGPGIDEDVAGTGEREQHHDAQLGDRLRRTQEEAEHRPQP